MRRATAAVSRETADFPDMTPTGLRTHSAAFVLFLLCASLPAWGQGAFPEWLAPFPQARDQTATSSSSEGASSYTVLARPADVISHYEQQMRAAGAAFKAQSDGIGVSIVVSMARTSAVVRLREEDGVTKVKVSYAVTADPPASAPPVPSPVPAAASALAQPAVPQQAVPISGAKRAPLSPLARAPYTWILQSSIVRGSNPTKYNLMYYEAPTDRSVIEPIPLPAGAAIVDVLPDDCLFSMQDQAGHSFTFKKGEEAKAKGLAPGTWSLYPMKCSGVSVFLR
jgi:hypothetical protein